MRWLAKHTPLAALAIAANLALCAGSAQAATHKEVNGACVMHAVSPVIPTTNLWHVRIGNKHTNPTGSHLCRGTYLKRTGKTRSDWMPFSLPNWNWHHILDLTEGAAETGTACAGFGVSLGAELPSAFFDTALTIGAGVGCVKAAVSLGQTIAPDNAKVPVVK